MHETLNGHNFFILNATPLTKTALVIPQIGLQIYINKSKFGDGDFFGHLHENTQMGQYMSTCAKPSAAAALTSTCSIKRDPYLSSLAGHLVQNLR